MLCTCFIEYTIKDKNKYTCSYSGILFQYVIDSEVGGGLGDGAEVLREGRLLERIRG